MQNTYKTTDFALATVLSMKYPVILQFNDKRATFVFDVIDGFNDFVAAFYNKELTVEPRDLLNQFKELKTRLHNEMQSSDY